MCARSLVSPVSLSQSNQIAKEHIQFYKLNRKAPLPWFELFVSHRWMSWGMGCFFSQTLHFFLSIFLSDFICGLHRRRWMHCYCFLFFSWFMFFISFALLLHTIMLKHSLLIKSLFPVCIVFLSLLRTYTFRIWLQLKLPMDVEWLKKKLFSLMMHTIESRLRI